MVLDGGAISALGLQCRPPVPVINGAIADSNGKRAKRPMTVMIPKLRLADRQRGEWIESAAFAYECDCHGNGFAVAIVEVAGENMPKIYKSANADARAMKFT